MGKILTVLIVTITFLGVSPFLHAVQNDPVPGGIALVSLSSISEPLPQVYYRKQRVLVHKNETNWQAVIGIPLSAKPGVHQLIQRSHHSKKRIFKFTVKPKEYEAQYITLKNKNKVSPNQKSLERIGREKKLMVQSFKAWRNASNMNLNFDLPVKAVRSSPFGLKRFFNQQPRKPHSGIDIAAPSGTPIYAPVQGRVTVMGDFFFNGKTVMMDHGQGLISMYCHMDRIDVQKNQVIKRGDILGAVGQTGRATGPHLHWSVSLNNSRIDPEYFLSKASLKVLNSEQ